MRCSKAVRNAAGKPFGKSAPRRRDFFGGSGSAWVAQLVERVLGKDEVTGSIPVPGSRICWASLGKCREVMVRKSARVSRLGGGNSTVESHSSKVMVAGSNPVPRSKVRRKLRG